MTTLEHFTAIAQNIIDAHPSGVHQLLMQKGITQAATPGVLLDVYRVYGNPFISELVKLVYSKPETANFAEETFLDRSQLTTYGIPVTGTTTGKTTTPTTTVTDPTQQKTFWDNLSSIFNSAANLGNATSSVISSIKNNNTYGSIYTTTPPVDTQNNGNAFLIVGVVIVIILLIIVFLTKSKSS